MANLTTLSAVREYIGMLPTVTGDDVLLSNLITRISEQAEQYCSRSFLSAARTETRYGNGSRSMVMKYTPISAVASLKIGETVIVAATTPTMSGYRIDGNAIRLYGYIFTKEAVVEVSYTGGHASTPPDVEQAVIETVMLAYRRKDHIDVSSKALAGETISYVMGQFSASAKAALGNHRRVTPV